MHRLNFLHWLELVRLFFDCLISNFAFLYCSFVTCFLLVFLVTISKSLCLTFFMDASGLSLFDPHELSSCLNKTLRHQVKIQRLDIDGWYSRARSILALQQRLLDVHCAFAANHLCQNCNNSFRCLDLCSHSIQ